MRSEARQRFAEALARFGRGAPVLVMGHHDADGLGALALFARALESAGFRVRTRIVGRGENPWSEAMAAELEPLALAGMIFADLGVRAGSPKPGTPLVIVDHHVPVTGNTDAVVISGDGEDPAPTSSLLAYWCASAIADVEPWLWIAALGIVGDMAEAAGFPEMGAARKRFGITALREATALVNAPRRAASGDASPALALLMKADGPKDLLSGRHAETAQLLRAREEVRDALAAVKRHAPQVKDDVALIRFASPCQLHPLVAQQWRGRLNRHIVLAANTGYRDGWVHFAARSARDIDLIEFLAAHAPPGADDNYGGGHRKATGGALRNPHWNAFIAGLGFGTDAQVPA